jgi:hypothetical protein
VKPLLLLLLVISLPAPKVAAAQPLVQRAKPVYDPETKDGLLIEHIQQETDRSEKLHYLEQFAVQYPSHQAIAWVYDQLQPEYFRLKEYEQAMRIGNLRLAIEPQNLEAATIGLRSADAKHDVEAIIKWTDRLYPIAAALSAKGGAAAAEAKQSQDYAEGSLYSTAMSSTDLRAKLELLQKLEQQMPSSKYAQNLTPEYFRIYRQLGDDPKSLEMTEKGLKADPDNFEMLSFLTEYHFRKENAKTRPLVVTYSLRLIESVNRAQRPVTLTDEEWLKKKAEMLGMANFMGGMSNSLLNNHAKADTMLRAALPYISKENEAQLPALLYHLGMANYRLAEAGRDRSRPVDALKFMRKCASMKSPFQDQAAKNVEGIRAEYNLP